MDTGECAKGVQKKRKLSVARGWLYTHQAIPQGTKLSLYTAAPPPPPLPLLLLPLHLKSGSTRNSDLTLNNTRTKVGASLNVAEYNIIIII